MNIKQYKDKVASLGCIVCGSQPELHHPRTGAGTGRKNSDWLVVPLCGLHHRTGTSYLDASAHGNPRDFHAKHGSDLELVAQVIERVSA